jgi:hypothetical protein
MMSGRKKFGFFVAVDFPDDLANATFDEKMLLKMFSVFSSWGVSRIYWIHTPYAEGFFANLPNNKKLSDNFEATYRNIGDFLTAAVRTAHACGMALYAVYKPNDLAIDFSSPFGTEEAATHGKMDSLSGRVYRASEGLVRLQRMRLQRKMTDVPAGIDSRVVKKIRLVSNRPGLTRLKKEALQIRTSDNNNFYEEYRLPFSLSESNDGNKRVITIDNLRVGSRYLSINTPYRDNRHPPGLSIGLSGGESCVNTLAELVEIYDSDGHALPFTYGLISRGDCYAGFNTGARETERNGYMFNWDNSAVFSGFLKTAWDGSTLLYAVDNNRGYIALAKGKEKYVTGVLSPAYSAVRAYWLKNIKECLVAGVDGVDIRGNTHSRNFEWESYGFERPVVREYMRRYKTNILREKFCREKQEDIIAERYTDFIREAARLVRGAGKKIQLHVGPDLGYKTCPFSCGRKWEWQKWIKEGLCDELTLKDMWPDFESVGTVCELSSKYDIPVYSCPWLSALPKGREFPRKLQRSLAVCKERGSVSGFILYESAAVVRAEKSGGIKILSPSLSRILKKIPEPSGF